MITPALAAVLIAIGIWWTSNTISHIFIHRPFFRHRAANVMMAAGLSALVGYPHTLWRGRHLAHHRGTRYHVQPAGELVLETIVVLSVWAALLVWSPAFFASAYLPGYVGGLSLCALHGYYEHAGGTVSHYSRLYNALCFNDGYHVEHHLHPGWRWTRLPASRVLSARSSAWPAPLRWLEAWNLETLERLVLHSPWLQKKVLRAHRLALRTLVDRLPAAPREITIVGGGLFPRTALIMRELVPRSRIVIVDESAANLERARQFLHDDDVTCVNARYEITNSTNKSEICNLNSELVVIPLSFHGDRRAIYARPPARAVIVHDWLWRARGESCVVSFALLKRANLVRR